MAISRPVLVAILTLSQIVIFAQSNEQSSWGKIEPFAAFQFWASYSNGTEVYDSTSNQYLAVEDRFNVQLRRSRFGVKSRIQNRLQFTVIASMDFVGRDVLSATQGGSNNGSSPAFRLWLARLQWQITRHSDLLHLTGGYLPIPFSREALTPALSVNSIEKAFSMNYVRRHLTGIGPGRATGIQAGGLLARKKLGLQYDFGVYSPVFHAKDGNSTGHNSAPLIVGRLALSFGDAEKSHYSSGYRVNYFGGRKGVTIAIAGAMQGRTDLFDRNSAAQADLLFNWGNWNVDAELAVLYRKATRMTSTSAITYTAVATTGHLRMSYNFLFSNGWIMEPVLMHMQYNGQQGELRQANALDVKVPAGTDHAFDLGINLYLNENKLKVSLHYTIETGDPGAAGGGATVNNHFFQAGAGAIRRGDWLGLGVVFKI